MSHDQVLPERYATTAVSPKRAAAVTGALAGVGAVAGGLTGILGGAFFMLNTGGIAELQLLSLFFPAMVGGVLGFVMGPVLAWLFFRTIPIGKAVLGTAAAALAGSAVATIAIPGSAGVALVGAVGGAVVGAAALWLAERLAGR